MGTPPFAATILDIVSHWEHGTLVAVYTQPDRPARRGQKPRPSAVKEWAVAHDIPVFQPETLKGPEEIARLRDLAPDFLLVAAYGRLIPAEILNIPTFPPLNVHGSLLPRYRGAAPVQRAIMELWNEGAETGLSIMQVVEALDAGPVYLQERIPIGEMSADELFLRMAHDGGHLLCTTMDDLREGRAHAVAQDATQASYAAKLTKNDGEICFDAPYLRVHAQIRAVTSAPGAHTCFHLHSGTTIMVTLMPGHRGEACSLPPGTLYADRAGLRIACADAWYCVDHLTPQGKRSMAAKDFVNGYLRALIPGVCGTASPTGPIDRR